MRKRRFTVLAVCVAFVVGVIVWRGNRSPEPRYQGQPLSEWLNNYDPRCLVDSKEVVDDAIRHIGTNAIPTLLEMLRARDGPIKLAMLNWVERHDLLWVTPSADRNFEAARGFEVLGDRARAAVPALIEILEEKFSLSSEQAAAYALGCIGPEARLAVPHLLPRATNADTGLRMVTVRALGQIQSEPALVVPALMRALDDGNQEIRFEAANALGAFGTNARAAIPALVEAVKSRDKHINKTAAAALKAIDGGAQRLN